MIHVQVGPLSLLRLQIHRINPHRAIRAANLSLEQLKDAGAHGADKSPEYQKRLEKLEATTGALTGKLATAQVTPSSIQAAADPLDAAKPAANVPPELVANLRAQGIVVPDQDGAGHGLNVPPTSSALARG
jgi:hypothetical protein